MMCVVLVMFVCYGEQTHAALKLKKGTFIAQSPFWVHCWTGLYCSLPAIPNPCCYQLKTAEPSETFTFHLDSQRRPQNLCFPSEEIL